jgi:hypothetical protein
VGMVGNEGKNQGTVILSNPREHNMLILVCYIVITYFREFDTAVELFPTIQTKVPALKYLKYFKSKTVSAI